jgi:hypothetical protein
MNELQTLRDEKSALKRSHSRIIQLYKQEIFDWCDHDLACKLAAEKGGVPERIVRGIVANAGAIFHEIFIVQRN